MRLLRAIGQLARGPHRLRRLASGPWPGIRSRRDAGWCYVFGSATLVAFLLQVVTGIGAGHHLRAHARARPTRACSSSPNQAPLGRLLRGMHYFGASAMVLLVGIHLIRVYLTGAYKFPREMNWLTGVLLLCLTLAHGLHRPAAALGPERRLVGGRGRGAGGPHARCWASCSARFILGGPTLGARHPEPLLRPPRLRHPGPADRLSSACTSTW